MKTTNEIARFNQAIEKADKLTGFLADTRSAEAVIWLLVSMGHLEQATELREASEAIKVREL